MEQGTFDPTKPLPDSGPRSAAGRAGRIELICGCMFSGKSLYLVEQAQHARQAGLWVAAFKHARDNRFSRTNIVTHDGQRMKAIPVASAAHLLELSRDADMVVIDEAQFFDDSLPNVCTQLADQGKRVLVSGLDRDSWGEGFGPIPALAKVADQITRTRATCARCGRPAEYTQRLVPVGERTMIGGSESYEPRCRECFQPPPIELRC
jgi:thymidine kinase